ncbi:MAG TPA: ATP-binding protein, partial [Cytophagaceae bacterium]
MKEKAIFCWSGGKDSTLALYKVLQENTIEVIGLLTTINKEHKRVSMHGIREELVEEQARQTGIPLIKMYISTDTSNTSYEKAMEEMLLNAKA